MVEAPNFEKKNKEKILNYLKLRKYSVIYDNNLNKILCLVYQSYLMIVLRSTCLHKFNVLLNLTDVLSVLPVKITTKK